MMASVSMTHGPSLGLIRMRGPLRKADAMSTMARKLDLAESAHQTWVKHVRANRTTGRTDLTTEAHEDLRRLRKKVLAG